MKIATWNVNSVKARLPHLLSCLNDFQPDVLLLQELKCMTEAFPYAEVEDCGYNVAVHGQKSYNGVAILSKFSIEDVTCGFEGDPDPAQSRYVEAIIDGKVRVASLYVPNGQDKKSPKYDYKLRFLKALHAHVENVLRFDEPFIMGGDYNIAPRDEDVFDPEGWSDEVLCSSEERAALRTIINLGLFDAVEAEQQRIQEDDFSKWYSWWDYRAGSWPRNQGLRIDHLLLSANALDNLKEVGVERSFRAQERPSDHVPVWATFS